MSLETSATTVSMKQSAAGILRFCRVHAQNAGIDAWAGLRWAVSAEFIRAFITVHHDEFRIGGCFHGCHV